MEASMLRTQFTRWINPNIARTQDSRLIFLNFDAELWNSIAFVPTHLQIWRISQRIG